MLQEKKRYSGWCIKVWIILAIIIFLIWTGLFIVLIFIFFIFFWWNKKTNINFTKVLESIWIYDCIKYIFWDYEKKDWNTKRNKWVIINNYLEKINKSIKKRAEELNKIEKIKRQRKTKKIEKTKILWEIIQIEEYKKEEKIKITNNTDFLGNRPKSKSKSKSKYEHSSFNNSKSIWDDYESVIDIINKRK